MRRAVCPLLRVFGPNLGLPLASLPLPSTPVGRGIPCRFILVMISALVKPGLARENLLAADAHSDGVIKKAPLSERGIY